MGKGQKYLLRKLMSRLGHTSLFGDYMYDKVIKHPRCSSLAAYHYILSWIGIENEGIQVTSDVLEKEIPMPALVHLNRNMGEFAIIEAIEKDKVLLTNAIVTETLNRKDFDMIFSGYCIAIASDSELSIDQKDFFLWGLSHLSKYILPAILLVGLLFNLKINLYDILFSGLYILGLVSSVLLYSKQLGLHIKLSDTICDSGGDSTDCNAVMGSKGGKLFGVLSWSEIGIIYFASALITITIMGFTEMSYLLLIMSILSFPYVFYSIWYQYKVVKTWCPLCLTVQAVFTGQLIAAIMGFSDAGFEWYPLLIFIIVGITVLSAFYVFKPIFEKSLENPYLISAFTRIKQHSQVRSSLINNTAIDMTDVNQIVINRNAKNIITFVFSPLCGPCIAKINGLLALLAKYDVGLRVVFCIKDHKALKDKPLIEYFISQYNRSQETFLSYMKEYSENYSVIRKKNKNFSEDFTEIIYKHALWFASNNFVGTPVILYNDRILPSNYNLDDLEIMISENFEFQSEVEQTLTKSLD